MLLDEKIDYLQNLTKQKITYEKVAELLGLGSKQAAYNRVSRKQPLKQWEENVLDDYYLEKNNEDENCTNLPILGNVSASMGYGITIYDETQTGTYAISNRLAKDLGINLKQADIIFATGDSMKPTIIGGDSVLVDKSKREIFDGRIYCIRYEDSLYIKRLQKIPPKKIKVVSDNQAKYDAWYVDFSKGIDFDFEIIGEVVWWGRVAK